MSQSTNKTYDEQLKALQNKISKLKAEKKEKDRKRTYAVGEVVVGTSASDRTTIGRIGGGCNLVAVQLELGNIACCLCHLEGIGRVAGSIRSS